MQQWWESRQQSDDGSYAAAHHERPPPGGTAVRDGSTDRPSPHETRDGPRIADQPSPTRSRQTNNTSRSDAGGSDPVRTASVPTAPPGPDATAPPPPSAIRSDVLLVNDGTISVLDVLEPISARLDKMAEELTPQTYFLRVTDMVRQQIIEAVAQHLIWRRAKEMITEDMEKQLDKAVDKMEKDRINREFQARETIYEKHLAKHGRTRDQVRERLRRAIVIDSYLRDRLTPLVPSPRRQELANYYAAHLDEFSTPVRRQMLLIDVPIAAFLDPSMPRGGSSNIEQARQKAKQTVEDARQALADGRPFEDVAKQFSRGVNADKGGDWGFIGAPLNGRWELPSARLFEMSEGQTSDVLETPDGFFIIRLARLEGGTTQSFQDAQPQIAESLRQQRFNKLRADFLQRELERSTIGSLDAFVEEVLRTVPKPQSAVNRAG